MAKIAFDAAAFNIPVKSGIPRYAYGLLSALLENSAHDYHLLGTDADRSWPRPVKTLFPPINQSIGRSNNSLVALLLRMHEIDLSVHLWGVPPVRRTCPAVTVVFDIIPLLYPHWAVNPSIAKFFSESFKPSLELSDRIVAISECTRKDLIEHYHLDPKRVTAIYPGIDSVFFELKARRLPRENKPYLLTTSVFEPRKNYIRLIEAYNAFRDRNPKSNLQLIAVGAKGWRYEDIFKTIHASPYSQDIIHAGMVSDAQLHLLYAGARGFVYPSLYEGFGLPVAEAMAAGVPTLSSNASSLPEVGGSAVLYCDPLQVDSILHGIEQLALDDQLCSRLSEAGPNQAVQFNWKNSARQFLEVMNPLLN